jgi:hypothetical protein
MTTFVNSHNKIDQSSARIREITHFQPNRFSQVGLETFQCLITRLHNEELHSLYSSPSIIK